MDYIFVHYENYREMNHMVALILPMVDRLQSFQWTVTAMLFPTAIAAEVTAPDGIELLDKWIDKRAIVCKDTILEVALALRLRAHPRTSEICGTEVRPVSINNDTLEMDSWAKHSFHPLPQAWKAVEVFPPVWPWLLRMDQPNLNPPPYHPSQDLQKRHHVPPIHINIHVLDIGGGDPNPFAHLWYNPADY